MATVLQVTTDGVKTVLTTSSPILGSVSGIPGGGLTGQALIKLSGTTGDVGWGTISSGGGTSDWTAITNKPAVIAAGADAASARAAIGAGTSNLALGSSSVTAKAGNYVPAWSDITNKPTVFTPDTHTSAIITDFNEAVQDAVAAMLVQGTGVSLAYNDTANTLTITSTATGGGGSTAWTDITGKPAVIAAGADAATARSVIGAGTSSLVLGSTSSTAKAGNYVPAWSELTGVPSTFTPASHTHTTAQVIGLDTTISTINSNITSLTTAVNNKPNIVTYVDGQTPPSNASLADNTLVLAVAS